MKLRLGLSPCPNDTFIFHALLHGLVDTGGVEIEAVMADVEELNVLMRDGAIEQVGTPHELYEKPANAFAAGFLGKSNFLHRADGIYALRPEKIEIRAAGTGEGTPRLNGTIQSITYFGSMQRIMFQTADGEDLEVDIDSWRNQDPLAEGQNADLFWDEGAAVKLDG